MIYVISTLAYILSFHPFLFKISSPIYRGKFAIIFKPCVFIIFLASHNFNPQNRPRASLYSDFLIPTNGLISTKKGGYELCHNQL